MENISIDNTVMVCKDFNDEDTSCNLKGWSGIVRMIFEPENEGEETEVLIEWDAETLKKMSDDFLISSFDNGQNWTTYYLPTSILEVLNSKTDLVASEWIKTEIASRLFWPLCGREGKHINKIFNEYGKDHSIHPMAIWYKFLEENFSYPIKAKIVFDDSDDNSDTECPIKKGTRLEIIGLSGWDLPMGIYCLTRYKDHEFIVPLEDIECTGLSKSSQYVNDYGIWIECRA